MGWSFSSGLVKTRLLPRIGGFRTIVRSGEKIKPYTTDEMWSDFTYTASDIEKYASEMRDKFISGAEEFDDDAWAKYVDTLEGMGLDEYMNIQEDAYERYQDN